MKQTDLIVVYGSYGYTGRLIVQLCKQKKLHVRLAGRNEAALQRQSEETGYPFDLVDSTEHQKLVQLLTPAKLVIHCAGPFKYTAAALAKACLETGTHYTDITGEHQVFESLAHLDAKAKDKGIMVMPGTGFDVVPSDCLAVHLKGRLPSATHLQLAFTMSKGGLSRGTAKSMTEGLGYGGLIRKNGELVYSALGSKVLEVDFGSFKTKTLCIPWGDISTAWRSTGIPNIEVYTGATDSMIANARRSNYLNWLLRLSWVKKFMLKQIDKKPAGPSEEKRESGRSFLWGKVTDASGKSCESRLQTLSGYKLTAETAVLIAKKILEGDYKVGYQTPAMAYSEKLILEVASTEVIDA
ncbi:MAG: saccharopine dehydrogenase family protein [Flammeovirgaceae bacterium]